MGVDEDGIEPSTSRMPSGRSTKLSYKPMTSGTGESNPVPPGSRPGLVTMPNAPEVPAAWLPPASCHSTVEFSRCDPVRPWPGTAGVERLERSAFGVGDRCSAW
jgi:hypothetical protein